MKRSSLRHWVITCLLTLLFLHAGDNAYCTPGDPLPDSIQQVLNHTPGAYDQVLFLTRIGNNYYSQYTPEGYGKAAEYFKKALDLALRHNLKKEYILLCRLMGAVNDALGDEHLPAALKYYQEFMYRSATELHDTSFVIAACMNNASVLRRMHRYHEARDAIRAAVILENQVRPPKGSRKSKLYITAAFYSACMNDTAGCRKYMALTDSCFYPFDNGFLPFRKYFRLTNFYLAAYDGRHTDALLHGNQALAEAANRADSIEVCGLLADYLRDIGNTSEALKYRETEYALYRQSLKLQSLKDADNKLLKSELFLKEENSRLLEQQQHLQQVLNTWLVAGLVILIFTLAYMFVLAFRSRKQNRQLARRNKEKAMLLREIHHRVKNNLEMLHSMLAMQMKNYRGDPNVQRALEEANSRIQSIALLHEQLYSSNLRFADAHDYFEKMFARILGDINVSRNVPVVSQLSIMPVQLPPDIILPVAMLINECLTNSIKYAFIDGQPAPTVILSLQPAGPGELQMIYADNGQSNNTPGQAERGFGSRLISSLARQLKGTLFVSHGNQGWQYILTLPFSNGNEQH